MNLQVCPSCRAFFRRSVQSGYNLTYACVKSKNCEMSLKTRKNCQYCRYKKCEDAGMKTAWVLTDEERKQKFEGRVKKKRKSGSSISEDDFSENACYNSFRFISEEESSELSFYISASEFHEPSKVHDMDSPLIREIIRLKLFDH